jgi:putative addiction module component (TIGR02574 family)
MASNDILDDALRLPLEERARIAHELLVSLHEEEATKDPEQVARAWAGELERRMNELDAGTVKAEDWSTVREQIAGQLRARRHR